MSKPEWGVKRICYNCGAKYYDMRRDPAVCPKCGTQFDPEAFLKSRRGRTVPAEPVTPKKKIAAEATEADEGLIADADEVDADAVETDDVESTDDDADADDFTADVDDDVDSVIEDADDLGDSDLDDVKAGGDDDDDR